MYILLIFDFTVIYYNIIVLTHFPVRDKINVTVRCPNSMSSVNAIIM